MRYPWARKRVKHVKAQSTDQTILGLAENKAQTQRWTHRDFTDGREKCGLVEKSKEIWAVCCPSHADWRAGKEFTTVGGRRDVRAQRKIRLMKNMAGGPGSSLYPIAQVPS